PNPLSAVEVKKGFSEVEAAKARYYQAVNAFLACKNGNGPKSNLRDLLATADAAGSDYYRTAHDWEFRLSGAGVEQSNPNLFKKATDFSDDAAHPQRWVEEQLKNPDLYA